MDDDNYSPDHGMDLTSQGNLVFISIIILLVFMCVGAYVLLYRRHTI